MNTEVDYPNGVEKAYYWNVNVPKEEWTDECPDFLADVDHWDKAQLSVLDSEYGLMKWEEVKRLITENQLQEFKRIPSELRRYREYIARIRQSHGSVMNFVLKERLQWTDVTPEAGPFEEPRDLKILYNDWPYGIDPAIVHLVVWVKFGFEEDLETGDLTPAARKLINDYVNTTFRSRESPERVFWFRNWSSLKSVHAVEHFHVMLYDPDPAFIAEITRGDVPTASIV